MYEKLKHSYTDQDNDKLQLPKLSENKTTNESATTDPRNLNDQLSKSSWSDNEETTTFALHRMSPIPLDDFVCDDSHDRGATTIIPSNLKDLGNGVAKGATTPLPIDLRSHRMSPIPIDDIPSRLEHSFVAENTDNLSARITWQSEENSIEDPEPAWIWKDGQADTATTFPEKLSYTFEMSTGCTTTQPIIDNSLPDKGSLIFEENGITIEFDDSIFGDGAFPIVLTVLFLGSPTFVPDKLGAMLNLILLVITTSKKFNKTSLFSGIKIIELNITTSNLIISIVNAHTIIWFLVNPKPPESLSLCWIFSLSLQIVGWSTGEILLSVLYLCTYKKLAEQVRKKILTIVKSYVVLVWMFLAGLIIAIPLGSCLVPVVQIILCVLSTLRKNRVTPIQRNRFIKAMPKKLQRKTNAPEARCPKEHNLHFDF